MEVVRHLSKKIVLAKREQSGVTLLETLIALALLGIFVVVFFSAISTGSITMANAEDKVNVDNLARAQLEYIKTCIYDNTNPISYATINTLPAPYGVTLPAGYTITVTAVPLHGSEDGIQEITVTISKDGQNLLTMKDYKVNR